MTYKDILKQFIEPTIENFPIKTCTIQNTREPTVFDSDTPFLCLVIDRRFKNDWRLVVLYPYICKESDTVTTFGWVDKHGNIVGNIYNSTQLWDEFVVGFQPYENTNDLDLYEIFLQKIEEQYED